MQKLKEKIIKLLGGYTLKEYNDAQFGKTAPVIKPIKSYHKVLINAQLATDLFNRITPEDAKNQIAIGLSKQLMDENNDFIEYSSSIDILHGQEIHTGTITVMKSE